MRNVNIVFYIVGNYRWRVCCDTRRYSTVKGGEPDLYRAAAAAVALVSEMSSQKLGGRLRAVLSLGGRAGGGRGGGAGETGWRKTDTRPVARPVSVGADGYSLGWPPLSVTSV